MDQDSIDASYFLKDLSHQDFLDVGMDQIAYIRCVAAEKKSDPETYVIHAADGSQISVMDSYDTAVAAIRMNDLFPITLN